MQTGLSDETASEWVMKWANRIVPGGAVLDLASGTGRHSRYLQRLGYSVLAVDRNDELLLQLKGEPNIATRQLDLELGSWPLQGCAFDGIVVTNYLHRPLMGHLLDALRPNGVLIYETFAAGNEHFGRPSNPDFLLQPGELFNLCYPRLHVMAYENLSVDTPKPAVIQRICAINKVGG